MGRFTRAVRRIARLAVVLVIVAGLAGLIRSRQALRGEGTGELPPWRGPAWLRHFVTSRFDPLVTRLGLVGGQRSPWAMLEHTGRKSGTIYRTPILPSVLGNHVVIPLPYGRAAHWVRNVQAAGHCRVQLHEHVLELDEPQLVPPDEVMELPDWRKLSVSGRPTEYLRLRVFSRREGTLDAVAPPAAAVIPVEGEGVPA